MRDTQRKRNSSRRRRSSSEEEFTPTKTPTSPPFSYYDEDEDDVDDDDDENLLEIIIDTLTGTTFQVRVSPWETTAGLKSLLHRTQGIPSSDQHILLGQTELVDDFTLIDQGIQDGANLKLVLAMKGGPINIGRNSSDDYLWREFSDYMDVNREELWDNNQGKPVTLLVLKEGENVNLYRVVENQDGTFTPLNESWESNSSVKSGKTDSSNDSRYEDELRHKQKMIELNAQMDAIKLRKKERRKQIKVVNRISSPKVRAPIVTKARRVRYNISSKSSFKAEPPLERPPKKFPAAHFHPDVSPRIPPLMSLGGSTPRFAAARGSRPSTQERRPSLSRGSRALDEIPRSQPPFHVDFSAYKKLDSIRSQQKRLSLDTLSEDSHILNRVTKPAVTNNKNYDVYRKTLVKHVKQERDDVEDQDVRSAWSGRDVPLPLYMEAEKPKKRRVKSRLYQSQNSDSLHPQKDLDVRPKTSPEILERRLNSADASSTMSDRIHIRAPDDKLKELINILNTTSRTNSRLSNSPPFQFSKSTAVSKSFPLANRRASNKTPLSISLASLQGTSPSSVPSTPTMNDLLASGAAESMNLLREIIKSQGTGRPSSKRSTPESKKKNLIRRPGSGHFKIISTPRGFIPVTPKKKKIRPRCKHCSKKIGVVNSYKCRCGLVFCSQHRYSEAHDCSYDYKTAGRKLIELTNPLVVPPKLQKF